MIAAWLKRLAGMYLRALWRDPITAAPRPSWPTASTGPQPSPSTPPQRRPRPIQRPPHVELPPRTADPRPSCWCGKRWTDTPQGWAAADRHNDLDLPGCGEAFRQRQRDRAALRRALIAADPVLAAQQRAYWREVEQRRRERMRAAPA